MEGYDYNPSTGTYVRNPSRRPSYPPPLPLKEPDPAKETHGAAELESNEGDSGTDYAASSSASAAAATTRRRAVRVLSLDGGGIRGYSTLVILQELMHQVYVQEHGGKPPKSPADLPRPCDYFDLIGGNGTGGLIALMLGRMRMDVESCKSYYVSLTRFVFITDKTLLGMPYGKTLFKASRLEEAIKHCVRESTRFDSEKIVPHSPPPPIEPSMQQKLNHRRTDSWRRRRNNSRSSSIGGSEDRGRTGCPRRLVGNPEAPLLDSREGACKTFVTAMLEGSRKGAAPVLLRSYPSPAESMHSYRTTIWQAGRATCATAAAFKSITIDQTTFLDEGVGMYNPAFQVLDEAHIHEFPDCDIGSFVSIGTGKRQQASQPTVPEKREWWEGVAFEGFAEAKRRLMRRIDDCERVHRELVDGDDGGRPRLAQGGVATQDYYRFNVEVGVGEFGMNEWNRLSEVATGTRRYLAQRETLRFVKECAGKLVAIERGCLNDGTKIKFRPTAAGHVNNDRHAAELASSTNTTAATAAAAAAPPIADHPFYTHKWQQEQLRQEQIQQQQQLLREQQKKGQLHQRQQQQQKKQQQHHSQITTTTTAVMPDENIYTSPITTHAPPLPPKPPKPEKPEKVGKVLVPVPSYAAAAAAADDTPNPEIRVTSPTTVAGGSDDENEDMYRGYGRRRRRRSRSRSGSGRRLAGVDE